MGKRVVKVISHGLWAAYKKTKGKGMVDELRKMGSRTGTGDLGNKWARVPEGYDTVIIYGSTGV